MRILVTGGAGFIGSNFARLAVRKGHDVLVFDKLTYAGNMENIRDLLDPGKIEFVQGDVCDARAVREAVRGCDGIVHFAAATHVDRSILEAGTFVQTDVVGTYVVLEAARQENVGRVVHISTDELYGESGPKPSREDSPLWPKSPYAASKAGADRLAYSYHATYDLPVVITRCVNNYGPYQHPEKAIPLFTICALVGHPLPVYGSGRNRREWIHVDDHTEALLAVLRAKGLEGETFNIGGQNEVDVLTVTDTILQLLGKPRTLIRHVEDRPGHDRRYAVDSSKLTRVTGWKPTVGFEDGSRLTVDWYRKNESWWRPIKQGEFRVYYERMYGQRKVLKEVRS